MPEAVDVHLIEADLGDADRPQRNPVVLHVGRPARRGALQPAEWAATDDEAVAPGVLLERDRKWRQLADQRDAIRGGQPADDAGVGEVAWPVLTARVRPADRRP